MSKKPLILTTHQRRGSDYDKTWFDRETNAWKEAGFDVETISPLFLGGQAVHDEDHFKDRMVFVRCYSEEEQGLERIIRRAMGEPLVPNMDGANNWYRNITFAKSWFGREIGHSEMAQYGYLDDDWQVAALKKHLGLIFDFFAVDGRVFFKADSKHTLSPKVRDMNEAYADISYWIALACHNRLNTLIFQQPIEIEHNTDAFGREEYRVFIVGDKVSTVSLFTDETKSRDYTRVIAYAEAFARQFCNFLPIAYCLDIAVVHPNEMVVIELNGIGASGFFADHDVAKLFMDIRKLNP